MSSLYLGMDLRKNFSFMTVLDDKGEAVRQEKANNTVEAMEVFFSVLAKQKCPL